MFKKDDINESLACNQPNVTNETGLGTTYGMHHLNLVNTSSAAKWAALSALPSLLVVGTY